MHQAKGKKSNIDEMFLKREGKSEQHIVFINCVLAPTLKKS